MKKNLLFPLFVIAVLLFGAISIIYAEAPTPILKVENKTASIGDIVKVNVTLTEAPNGLSGYNLTIALSNFSVAEIESVEFPDWAILNANSSLPYDSVWIKAIDLYKQVQENATNVQIAALLIKAKSSGTSAINVSKTRLDDDSGYEIDAIPENGTIVTKVNNPLYITITSPEENKTYASICVKLNFSLTVEEGVTLDWIAYSLDGNANVTIEGTPRYPKVWIPPLTTTI
jgi:hypothetical protein